MRWILSVLSSCWCCVALQACASAEQCADGLDDGRCSEILGRPGVCRANVCVDSTSSTPPDFGDAGSEEVPPPEPADPEHCTWQLHGKITTLEGGFEGSTDSAARLLPSRASGKRFVEMQVSEAVLRVENEERQAAFVCSARSCSGPGVEIKIMRGDRIGLSFDLDERRLGVARNGVTVGEIRLVFVQGIAVQLQFPEPSRHEIDVAPPSPPPGYAAWCGSVTSEAVDE